MENNLLDVVLIYSKEVKMNIVSIRGDYFKENSEKENN